MNSVYHCSIRSFLQFFPVYKGLDIRMPTQRLIFDPMEIGKESTTGVPIVLDDETRRRHTYIIGQTGVGKSSLLFNMIVQDIEDGKGVAFIDPHGDEAEKLLDYIPPERIQDVIYFSPKDYIIPFNPLDPTNKTKTLQTIDSVFKSVWPGTYGESSNRYIFLNVLRTALFYPNPDFLRVKRLLMSGYHRESGIKDDAVLEFWHEFNQFSDKDKMSYSWSTINKLGQFLMDPMMRDTLCSKTKIRVKDIMDKGQIFIANLSKGHIGHLNMRLLGGLLVGDFLRYAMEREQRNDFYLYLDEFQNFASPTFETILSEARKYRLNLILAHQYLDQLDRDLQSAIFGNAGTWLSFKVGHADAKKLADQYGEVPQYFTDLSKYEMYANIMGSQKRIKTNPPEAICYAKGESIMRRMRGNHAA